MRIPKFQRLRRLGVCPARVIRTGGKACFVYGEACMGVPDHLLRDQRRAVQAAVAPVPGTGGQQLDLALLMADGGPVALLTRRSMPTSSPSATGLRLSGKTVFLGPAWSG